MLSAARNAGVITGLGITAAIYTAAGSSRADGAAASIFGGAAAICLLVAAIAAVMCRGMGEVPDPRLIANASLEGRSVSASLAVIAGNHHPGSTP